MASIKDKVLQAVNSRLNNVVNSYGKQAEYAANPVNWAKATGSALKESKDLISDVAFQTYESSPIRAQVGSKLDKYTGVTPQYSNNPASPYARKAASFIPSTMVSLLSGGANLVPKAVPVLKALSPALKMGAMGGFIGGAFNKVSGGDFKDGFATGAEGAYKAAPYTNAIVGATNPLIGNAAYKMGLNVQNPLLKEGVRRLTAGVGNTFQGMPISSAYGQNPLNPTSLGIDFASGVLFPQSPSVVGKGAVGRVPNSFDPEDAGVLDRSIDILKSKKSPTGQIEASKRFLDSLSEKYLTKADVDGLVSKTSGKSNTAYYNALARSLQKKATDAVADYSYANSDVAFGIQASNTQPKADFSKLGEEIKSPSLRKEAIKAAEGLEKLRTSQIGQTITKENATQAAKVQPTDAINYARVLEEQPNSPLLDALAEVYKDNPFFQRHKVGGDDLLAKARKQIGEDAADNRPLKEKFSQGFDSFYTNWVNKYNPIEKLTKEVEKATNSKIIPSESPEYAVTRLLGAGGKAELRHKSKLKPILSKISPEEIEDFEVFLKASRDLELSQREGGVIGSDGFESQKILQTLAEKYDIRKYNQIADELYAYQREGLEMLKGSGIISDESYKQITAANQKYVPFNRIMDEVDDYLGLPTNKGYLGTNPVKKLKGSERAIKSPLDSIIANTYKVESAVSKNRVAKSVANLRNVSEDMQEVIHKVSKSAPDTISVWENGQKVFYKVPKDVADSVKGLNEENMNTLIKMASWPSKILRQNATGRNIDFMIPNVVRDQFDATLNSKYGYKPFVGYVDGLIHLINYKYGGGDEVVESWMDSGGKMFFDEMSGRKSLKDQVSSAEGESVLRRFLGSLTGGVETIGDFSELPTRIGLYKNALDKTGNELIASKEAREATLDFARMGAKMKVANSLVPFLNASVQGFDKMARTFADDPKTFSLKMGALAGLPALSVSLYNNFFHGEEYAEIPDFVKASNFVLLTGGRDKEGNPIYLTLPKGHIAPIVANPLDNFVTWLAGNNPKTFSQLALSTLSDAMPVVGEGDSFSEIAKNTGWGLAPQAIKVPMELTSNYNSFRGEDIVPYYLEDAQPYEQAFDSTEVPYKLAGAVTNQSPLRVKHFLESTLAGAVKNPVDAFETVRGAANGNVNLNNIPVARRFVGSYAGFDNDRPEITEADNLTTRLSSLLPRADASTSNVTKIDITKAAQQEDSSLLGKIRNMFGSTPDKPLALPDDLESLKVIYKNASSDMEGYKEKKTEIEYGNYKDYEKKKKLKDLEEDYAYAQKMMGIINDTKPKQVFEIQIATYGKEHPSDITVEHRGDWAYEQLTKAMGKSEEEFNNLLQRLWDEGVLTSKSNGVAAYIQEKYGLNVWTGGGSGGRKKAKKLPKINYPAIKYSGPKALKVSTFKPTALKLSKTGNAPQITPRVNLDTLRNPNIGVKKLKVKR